MLTKSLFSLSKNIRIPQCTSLFHSLISKKDKQKELIRMSQNIHNTDQETYLKKLEIASNFVKKNLGTSEIAMVLGTGLGPITNEMKDKVEIPFSEIPYMVSPSVLMHKGSLISGTISGKKVLALSGRIHPYEGYPEHLVFFNVQVMSECGCKLLFVTNAAGGGIKGMKPGDVMAITGHTTSNFQNLLTSIYNIPSLVPKSMNLEPIYSKRILKYAKQSAKKLGIKWFEGTYAMMQGPTFESHSEIDSGLALKTGAFGMSTGIETLAGKAAGMEIFGISFISNLAAGLEDGPLTHHDVLEVADEAGYKITQIVSDLVNTVPLLDRPEKNNREIECNQIVPVPIPVLPEQKEFDEAVSYLRSKIYFDPRVAVLLAPGHDEAFLRKLKCKREILYKDLPNFPLISPSSNKGKIVYGETENKIPILCLVGNDHKGLYDSEVTFLVKLFKDYGIESFGQTFLAGDLSYFENSNNQKPKARVMLTNDILNLVTFPDGILNDLEYESKAPQLFDEQFLNKMETIAKEKSINYTVGSLSSTTNCVLPIRSELEKYKNVGMSNLGLTNLTAILAARNLGIKTFSLADLCFDYSNYQDISIPKAIQDVKENSSEDIASLTISAIDQSINKNPNSQKAK
ncbi:hypothetical protein M0812_24339 [Anaeramoeba flamelloides]|uniref:purine-nucleoside phosphorylase n=1 Tax=Anaeramoeba flamelloides TaxID=1746091 RepID=A0AAV7YKG8_9EUKA|nr:hypothetical protein M0812_24339 [Anaeramoeba flamelloides]